MIDDLPELRIGPHRLDVPVVLAPLAGYTDLAFRGVCRRLGAPYCATEMMLDRQMLLPGKLRRRLVHLDDDDHPIAGQIVGSDPATMASAAADLAGSGFDVVDVNFACPVRKVLRRGRGGHLLRDPARAAAIVRAVAAAVDVPVTVKLRTAFDADAGHDAFWRIADAAFDAGAAALCVHARTVEQHYRGQADWDFIAEVKRRYPDRTVIGSGDVADPPAAVAMLRHTHADGAAFARGAIGNPWVFRQFRDHVAGRPMARPSLAEQREVMARQYDHTVALYGGRLGPRRMMKFGIKYSRQHPTPAKVRAAFVAAKTPAGWRRVLEKFYDPAREYA